jgi:ubiquinone/menaquinone biosynthesis C-methylase UbiE
MDLTKPELKNREVFSREESLKEYSQLSLFPVEERIFKKHFFRPGRILDIGCGCGRTAFFLRDMGHSVVGIDIVPEMLDIARKLVPGVSFKLMDACELSFEDESFDYVLFSYNGIDYISPETKRNICLGEIHRVLKKNHPFVFSTHNAVSLTTLFPTNRFRLNNLLLNLRKRRIFNQYRLERHPSGILETYSTTIFKQKEQLRKSGFRNIKIYGQKSNFPIFIAFFDVWPYYCCLKR